MREKAPPGRTYWISKGYFQSVGFKRRAEISLKREARGRKEAFEAVEANKGKLT